MREKDFHEQAAGLYRQLANLHQQRAQELGAPKSYNVGETGRIIDLSASIVDLLADQPNLGTAEVTDALFTETLGIDRGTFRRRVTVSISSLHVAGVLWSFKPLGAKVTRWHLSDKAREERAKRSQTRNDKGAEAPSS